MAGNGDRAPGPADATWAGAAAALAVFALIAVVGSRPGVVALNVWVLRALQAALPTGSLDAVSLVLVFGSSQVSLGLLGIGGVWLYLRGHRLVALSLGFVLVGVGIELVLKATIGHPLVWGELFRGFGLYPFPEIRPTVVTLVSPFPSGHVFRVAYLGLTAVAVLSQHLSRRGRTALRVISGLVVGGVVFGVLYFGWHWPTDALGSLALAYALTAPTRWAVGLAGAPKSRAEQTD